METYFLIFVNSLKSAFLLSTLSENAWFAAKQFGVYNMWLVSGAALCGSVAGSSINFAVGYFISTKRKEWFKYGEPLYQRISKYFRYLVVLLLLQFPVIPVLGTFMALFIVLCGVFRAPPIITIVFIIIGKIAYYSYYSM